eukprot:TRINITY_DN268_c0_g1_i1.p1 TRINITY_DN268_c0_g1~~TRINITY_DN268_c0_g1_i1.p1  ORF type:complete len:179 (-),score=48.69 TRINITY_DN268_c0_g1_i1:166-702(-)
MRLSIFVVFALAIVITQAESFDGCRKHLVGILQNAVFKLRDVRRDYVDVNRELITQQIYQIWHGKCGREIAVVVSKNADAAAELYYGNEELYRAVLFLREPVGPNKDYLNKRFAYYNNFIKYFGRFQNAVVAAYRNRSKQNCRERAEDLKNFKFNTFEANEQTGLGKIFLTMEICESN